MDAILVAIGGAIGSLARFGVNRFSLLLLPDFTKTVNWPGTLAVNVFGAFIIAFVTMGMKEARPEATWITPLLIVGFCGGFTTFSTFALDGYKLWTSGETAIAFLYVFLSLLLSLGALLLGFWVAGHTIR